MKRKSKLLLVMLIGFALFQIGETIIRPIAGIAWLAVDFFAFTVGGLLTFLAWTANRWEQQRFKNHLKKSVGWDWVEPNA